MTPKTTVDIVIPVYYLNADELSGSIATLHAFCRAEMRDYSWRIVIANNGPRKDVLPVAEALIQAYESVFIDDYDLPGRGGALRLTWGKSQAEIVMYMDVDLSADLSALSVALGEIRSGWDVVVGSRYLKESTCKRPMYRHAISLVFNRIFLRHYLRVPFSDAQCGFKALSKKAAAVALPLTHDHGWFFDTELLYLAHFLGLRCKEIPVAARDVGPSGVRFGRTIIDFLVKIIKLRRAYLPCFLASLSEERQSQMITANRRGSLASVGGATLNGDKDD